MRENTEANKSLLSQERGLKHPTRLFEKKGVMVAPFAGAWIETHKKHSLTSNNMSLLSQERGLKLLEVWSRL